MSFLSGWLRVGQDGCWLAGPWAGLLAGWLLGGLLLAGRLGGWQAGLWSRLGWLSWSGLGWLAAAGGRAGWLQRLTGKRPATGGQPPGGQSVPCRARKIGMLHPFGNPHLGQIKWKSNSTRNISKQDHKSKCEQKLKEALHFQSVWGHVQWTREKKRRGRSSGPVFVGQAPACFENEARP